MVRFDKRLFENFDMVFLLLVIAVSAISWANLYSASFPLKGYGTPAYVRQGYYFIMGLMLWGPLLWIDYHKLQKVNYGIYVVMVLSLAWVLFFGSSSGGSQRWINLVVVRVQPSEFAKLFMIITLASYYARRESTEGYTLKMLLVPGLLTLLPFVLILVQPDLGTSLMLIFIFASMTFFVKCTWKIYAIAAVGAPVAIAIAWTKVLKSYQKERVLTFLDPSAHSSDQGYQIIQSIIAVGSGEKFGKGYLAGPQSHLSFVPEHHTDFAFAVLGEEWGFVGTFIFMALYFAMLVRGLHIGMQAKDRFGTLLAFGIVSLIFWQAVVNILMVLGQCPVVGMPLPLFSYGGSSLLTTLIGVAIILNVSMRRFTSN